MRAAPPRVVANEEQARAALTSTGFAERRSEFSVSGYEYGRKFAGHDISVSQDGAFWGAWRNEDEPMARGDVPEIDAILDALNDWQVPP